MKSFLNALEPVWTPHDGQRAFLTAPHKIRVLACGRRWGKTDACAAATLFALTRDSPTKHVLIAPTQDQAKLLFDRVAELLERLLEKWPFPRGPSEERPKVSRTPYPKLTFGPHRVTARSGHLGRSLRGNEATHIVIDEAAFLAEEVITEVAMPMLATTNGELTMISTPRGMNHFWRFFHFGVEGQHGVWSRRAPSSESPLVSPEYLQVQRDLISERAFRTEYEAEFLDGKGRVFRTELIDAALTPRLEVGEGPFWIGVDWARYSDYTAVAVLAGTRDRAHLVEADRFHGLPWAEQVERVARLIERYPQASVLCDATGVGDPLVEQLQRRLSGCAIEGATFTAGFKAQLIDRLVWSFENQALRMEPNPELIRELSHFEWQPSRSGQGKLGASSGFHDDLVIALALAAFQLPHAYRPQIQLGGTRNFSTRQRKEKNPHDLDL